MSDAFASPWESPKCFEGLRKPSEPFGCLWKCLQTGGHFRILCKGSLWKTSETFGCWDAFGSFRILRRPCGSLRKLSETFGTFKILSEAFGNMFFPDKADRSEVGGVSLEASLTGKADFVFVLCVHTGEAKLRVRTRRCFSDR